MSVVYVTSREMSEVRRVVTQRCLTFMSVLVNMADEGRSLYFRYNETCECQMAAPIDSNAGVEREEQDVFQGAEPGAG